jgi:hypothetical protein
MVQGIRVRKTARKAARKASGSIPSSREAEPRLSGRPHLARIHSEPLTTLVAGLSCDPRAKGTAMHQLAPLLALLPIFVVGVLMVGMMWPSSKAMPVGLAIVAALAFTVWEVPAQHLLAASLAGLVNALDILLIIFGAILILQLMKHSGGMDAISLSMATISKDRRVQVLIIA